tara:strand:+ start:175 stop:795 length:621 start_codon:yes stop_codon:yes gene_type:complete
MEGPKLCNKCQVYKNIIDFHKHRNQCKLCQKEYLKNWYKNNKENRQKYRENNKERIKEYEKKYRENNKDYKKVQKKKWNENNKNHMKAYNEITKEHRNECRRTRYNTDSNVRMRDLLRSRLTMALNGKTKSESTLELLGCPITFLIFYLRSQFQGGMTWNNIEVDHVIPCCSFNLENEDEQKKCFHFTNLQPLWVEVNREKSGKSY